jgi:hypothetical protein
MITGRPSISLLCRALSPAWCPDTKLLTNGQLKPAGKPRLLSTSTCTTPVPVRGAGGQRRCPTRALAFVWAGFTAMLPSIPVGTGAAGAGVHSLSGLALVWRAVSLMMDVSRCQPRIRFSLRQSSFVSEEAPPKRHAASAVTGCVLPIGGLSRRNTTTLGCHNHRSGRSPTGRRQSAPPACRCARWYTEQSPRAAEERRGPAPSGHANTGLPLPFVATALSWQP